MRREGQESRELTGGHAVRDCVGEVPGDGAPRRGAVLVLGAAAVEVGCVPELEHCGAARKYASRGVEDVRTFPPVGGGADVGDRERLRREREAPARDRMRRENGKGGGPTCGPAGRCAGQGAWAVRVVVVVDEEVEDGVGREGRREKWLVERRKMRGGTLNW